MLQYIFDGKSMMYPIVLLFVIGLAVIIDRALAFRAATRNNKKLTDDVIEALYRTILRVQQISVPRSADPLPRFCWWASRSSVNWWVRVAPLQK